MKHFFMYHEVQQLSQGKTLVRLFELQTELFFMEHRVYLKEQLTDWLFKLGYMVNISSRMDKMSLSLQGKQLSIC